MFCFLSSSVTVESILKFWQTVGVEHGELVLQDLGLANVNDDDADVDTIDVEELSKMLMARKQFNSLKIFRLLLVLMRNRTRDFQFPVLIHN
jgi:hypothetical protein